MLLEPGFSSRERGHHCTGEIRPITARESREGVRPLSRWPGTGTSWGDRRGRPPLTTRTPSSSTCSGARTSERRSPSSPDHQPGSQHAPGQQLDAEGQVEEHRGRQGQHGQELAAKLGAEKEKVENEMRK